MMEGVGGGVELAAKDGGGVWWAGVGKSKAKDEENSEQAKWLYGGKQNKEEK